MDKEFGGNHILRWAAMPFAAVTGALLGAVVLALFIRLTFTARTGGAFDDVFIGYITPVLLSAIFSWLYVLIVYALSPRSKGTAVLVMTTALCVVGVLLLVMGWVFASEDTSLAIRATLQILTAIIVAVWVAKYYSKE